MFLFDPNNFDIEARAKTELLLTIFSPFDNDNLQQINNFSFPLPPLGEQERIVTILDKFEALVNDISIGLPAELSARRSQYEYYRGKLLTFNEYAK